MINILFFVLMFFIFLAVLACAYHLIVDQCGKDRLVDISRGVILIIVAAIITCLAALILAAYIKG